MTATSDSFRTVTRALSDLDVLECMAQEELANHFSCLKAMLSSLRPDYMADCADEFRKSVVRKCEMAFDITMPVVLSLHGIQHSEGTERIIREAYGDPEGPRWRPSEETRPNQCAVVES